MGCCYTSSKYFQISCISVSLLVGLHSTEIRQTELSPVLDEIFSMNFFGDIPGMFEPFSKSLQIFCMSVSLLVGLNPS